MLKFLTSLATASLAGIATAAAHPSAVDHAHPHEATGIFTPEMIVAIALGLAIGGAVAFVRKGRGE